MAKANKRDTIWKDINGYNGLYQVSNDGQVRSWKKPGKGKGKAKKPTLRKLIPHHRSGELQVMLHNNGDQKMHSVHRLVANAFIENANQDPEINHKDGDRNNNNVENLEWCTHKENMAHAYKNSLIDNNGSKNGMAKLTKSDVEEIKELRNKGNTLKEIGDIYDISFQHVSRIVNNKRWSNA